LKPYEAPVTCPEYAVLPGVWPIECQVTSRDVRDATMWRLLARAPGHPARFTCRRLTRRKLSAPHAPGLKRNISREHTLPLARAGYVAVPPVEDL